jgi:hypothetical protein
MVFGPIDHSFCQSIYFAGPEGLVLELMVGVPLDPKSWIDPEVVAQAGISADELERYKSPVDEEPAIQSAAQPASIGQNRIRISPTTCTRSSLLQPMSRSVRCSASTSRRSRQRSEFEANSFAKALDRLARGRAQYEAYMGVAPETGLELIRMGMPDMYDTIVHVRHTPNVNWPR